MRWFESTCLCQPLTGSMTCKAAGAGSAAALSSGVAPIRVGSSEEEQRQQPQAVGSNPTRPTTPRKKVISMPIVYCEYCGTAFAAQRSSAKYCNWDCYSKSRLQDPDNPPRLKQDELDMRLCPYNDGVLCFPVGDCGKCGWNPKVAEARLVRIRAQLFGQEVSADGS